MGVDLGEKRVKYQHRPISLRAVAARWVVGLLLTAFCLFAATLWRVDSPLWAKVLSICFVIIFYGAMWLDYALLNKRPSVALYAHGLVLNGDLKRYGIKRETYQAAWDDVVKVIHVTPDWVMQKMVGFYIQFKDGEKLLVPQSISDYEDLYQELRKLNILGTESDLKLYQMDFRGDMKNRKPEEL